MNSGSWIGFGSGAAALFFALGWWCGCGRDVRLTGRPLPKDLTVRTVTHYDQTLDKEATPEQVAYVLLRALRDDALADSKAARNEALQRQFDVSASGLIGGAADAVTPPEALFRIVYGWAPTIAHYAADIETEWEKSQSRFVRLGPQTKGTGPTESQIMMEVRSPDGDPNAQVVLLVGLVQDEGYWRAIKVAYLPRRNIKGNG